jgi:hypothetical protein
MESRLSRKATKNKFVSKINKPDMNSTDGLITPRFDKLDFDKIRDH